MNNTLSVKNVLQTGLRILLTNKLYILKVYFSAILIQLFAFGLLFLTIFLTRIPFFTSGNGLLAMLLTVAVGVSLFVVAINLQIGIWRTLLGLVDGRKVPLKNLLQNFGSVWHYIITTLFVGIITLLGLVLLIIPGIYLAIRLSFSLIEVIDPEFKTGWKNITLNYSWQLTQNKVLKVFFIYVASIFLPVLIGYSLSALIGVMGILDAIPVILRIIVGILLFVVVLTINLFSGVYAQLVTLVMYRKLQTLQNFSPTIPLNNPTVPASSQSPINPEPVL